MRILVDIPEEQVRAVEAIGRATQRSRASILREAVGDYLRRRPRKGDFDAAFGSWGAGEDGLEYQRRVRDEW